MEGGIRRFLGYLQGAPDTPLAAAQELMYEAFESRDPARRQELAREALTISPDCADAYVLLAERARGPREALSLYTKGVEAGERALGPAVFQEAAGHFWGILETRPYMRAREGLAATLWTVGRRDEAIDHLKEMLRLNPNDNQGIRYTLVRFLLAEDRDAELAQLLDQYPNDDFASWTFTRALLAFRQQGDTPDARRLLQIARKSNRYVLPYLLGERHAESRRQVPYSPGDASEAMNYAMAFQGGWTATRGAIDWLRRQAAPKGRQEPQEPEPKGPLTLVKTWLNRRLPQAFDVWQADFRRLPYWVRIAKQPLRPWLVLVMSQTNDLVLTHHIGNQAPTSAHLWDYLTNAMQEPRAGEPHRPTVIQVPGHAAWEELRPHLKEIGVDLVPTDDLDFLNGAIQSLNEQMSGKPEPGILDMPGVRAEMASSFFTAASDYYRLAPWRKVGDGTAIQIECDRYRSGPWYAVVMGQSGVTFGLALYEDLRHLRRIWTADLTDEENARGSEALTVTLGEEFESPPADVDAALKHGWPLPAPGVYPHVFRKERGLSLRPPLAWELELVDASLRAVPGFVERHAQDDAAVETITVRVPAGPLALKLSLVAD